MNIRNIVPKKKHQIKSYSFVIYTTLVTNQYQNIRENVPINKKIQP